MALSVFEELVLKRVGQVPVGRVTTYAVLAFAISRPKAARAVGQALNKNPFLITVPCHRVVRSDGTLGGYRLGQRAKRRLLVNEGLSFRNNRIKNFQSVVFNW